VQELLPAPGLEQKADMPATPASSSPSSISDITDFRPLWLGEALLLTRRVTTPERQWIQGAWLDWDKLRTELLTAVQDRFPDAKVVRAPDNPEPGAHLLASLPVMLVPGAVTLAAPPFWSPLKVSLSIAWLCVLLAIAAVALVLRGMMALSERRASFVSSVTHELRTPLATFKLYSEMLADGMVKEETKKQQYLETLTSEADRLGHLVENVLAYSRIERGKGPCAVASLTAGDLVKRIEPRLNQRALLAGMDFALTADPAALETPLRTDAGAVEQILCNLVDNACKYGRRDSSPGKVELVVTRERRRLCLTVRDHGPGIPRGEQNTIFLPFHKSARDAAHSAPGVGLGLALCRRLAGELCGTLEMDRSWTQGAAFVLRLPA
jgi:signal transduction histidine kinase